MGTSQSSSSDGNEFTLLEKVGSGSFGSVYKARWRGDVVAVKLFKCSNQEIRRSFEREKGQLLRLNHPNIVRLFDAGAEDETTIFLVMEFSENGSLYKALHGSSETYTMSDRMNWSLQCALGVQYLHSQQIVHRDLKPLNSLLFDGKQTLKICDFGTARGIPNPSAAGAEDFSMSMTLYQGTPAYIAHEVLDDKHYNEKCDVYSWGVLFWETVTGKKPFQNFSIEALKRHLRDGKTLEPVPHNISQALQNLLRKCWSFNPAQRPTMAEVVQVLRAEKH